MAKRDLQEINAGSMADIAFLLLIFFLMTTTMDTDKGLARMLPPPVPDEIEEPPVTKERNVFEVLINSRNLLLVENQYMNLRDLKDATKEFLQNPLKVETLPEIEMMEIDYFGVYPVTKNAVISLQSDRGTQYQMYLNVQNELQAAITELRNEVSLKQFNKKYDKLDKEQQAAVREIYPQRISEAEPRNIGGRK
jgi:biopolymer transport protein ExbD